MKKKTANKYIVVFIIGCIIGCAMCAIFYPSKTIVKTKEVSSEKDTNLIENLKKQINSLSKQNKRLAEKTYTVIVERADGSKRTEIKTETDLYETKTKEVKEKYEKQLEEAKKEISELKEKEKIEINKKRFGIELGILASRNYYVHINADVFGPVFIGVQTQIGTSNTLGVGLGLRL